MGREVNDEAASAHPALNWYARPAYAFALALLAGFAGRLYERHRLLALLALLVVAEVAIFYAPLSGELPIATDALNARLFFKFWR